MSTRIRIFETAVMLFHRQNVTTDINNKTKDYTTDVAHFDILFLIGGGGEMRVERCTLQRKTYRPYQLYLIFQNVHSQDHLFTQAHIFN